MARSFDVLDRRRLAPTLVFDLSRISSGGGVNDSMKRSANWYTSCFSWSNIVGPCKRSPTRSVSSINEYDHEYDDDDEKAGTGNREKGESTAV